jgi:hypothetical protein
MRIESLTNSVLPPSIEPPVETELGCKQARLAFTEVTLLACTSNSLESGGIPFATKERQTEVDGMDLNKN